MKAIGQEKYYNQESFMKAVEMIILSGDVASGDVNLGDMQKDFE